MQETDVNGRLEMISTISSCIVAVGHAVPRMFELLGQQPVQALASKIPSLLAVILEELVSSDRNRQAAGMTSNEYRYVPCMTVRESAAGLTFLVVKAFLDSLELWSVGSISIHGGASLYTYTGT